jgi:8-oxo-dGTP pyrophosphatase MutT (NUDIX family)
MPVPQWPWCHDRPAVTFADVVQRLETGLRGELPGPDAQERLAPFPRRQWPAGFNPARIRHAAGLLLVFPKTIDAEAANPAQPKDSADAHIVLTVRADSLGRHGGQVSLPGGVVEPGETFEQTALREAHEEIGLPLEPVRVLGSLTSLDIPISGFRLHPVVAVTTPRPTLAPSDGEVAHILEVAVDHLLDPAYFALTDRERGGFALTIPAFHVGGQEIWGATAMVLAEFLALLGWTGHSGR